MKLDRQNIVYPVVKGIAKVFFLHHECFWKPGSKLYKTGSKYITYEIQIPVKLFVLPAVYDNVDTGIDHKKKVGEVGQEVRPEVEIYWGKSFMMSC